MSDVFITRTGKQIPMDGPLTPEHVSLDDITCALSMLATLRGQTVIPWTYAARALECIEIARQLSADKQPNRDEILSVVMRSASDCYMKAYTGYTAAYTADSIKTAIAAAFGFKWVSTPITNEIITTCIQKEIDQLLPKVNNHRKCYLPNYAHVVAATKLRTAVRKILDFDQTHVTPTVPALPVANEIEGK